MKTENTDISIFNKSILTPCLYCYDIHIYISYTCIILYIHNI